MARVWISKHALTVGLFAANAEIKGNTAIVGQRVYKGEGLEWHQTQTEAIARAEHLRKKKIALLKMRINHLMARKFDPEKMT